MQTFDRWQDYAEDLVTKTLNVTSPKVNHAATVAALSLINMHWEDRHPSWHNTQFAVGAFLLPKPSVTKSLRMAHGGKWSWGILAMEFAQWW